MTPADPSPPAVPSAAGPDDARPDASRPDDASRPRGTLALHSLCDDDSLTVVEGLPATPAAVSPGPPVVVFNSIGNRTMRPEFLGTVARLGRPVLFVLDHRATWYAAPDLAPRIVAAVEAAMARWGAEEVDTLGFSMGGYPAIAYAQALPVRHAVALAPRFSPDPAILPDPRDRASLRRLSGRFAFPTLEPGLARLQGGLILHGMRGPDIGQFRHIHAPAALDHWLLPQADHFVVRWLRGRGLLERVVLAGLAGDRATTARLLAGAGALRHRSLAARLALHPVRAAYGLAGMLRR